MYQNIFLRMKKLYEAEEVQSLEKSITIGRYRLVPVFRIRIRLDPDSNCQTGSGSVFGIRIRILKVKLSYKNPLFPQILNDFHLFLKMIRCLPNKSSMFNGIPTNLIG